MVFEVTSCTTREPEDVDLEFYCDPPRVFAKAGWTEAIDALMVRGFGGKDPEIWNADWLLVMKLGDELLGATALDEFDFGFGARVWIESLTIPDHPLKTDLSLFSLFWEFIWESIHGLHLTSTVSLLVNEDGPNRDRLVGIYARKGMVVEQCVSIAEKPYLVMTPSPSK